MQRTEERRGKYSSSSEEDREIDQNKTNPKKRSSATNKTFEKLSKKQASDVKKVTSGKAAEVKPRLSDVVLSDDEEKETKQIDHVKQSIVRLIVGTYSYTFFFSSFLSPSHVPSSFEHN